MSFHAIPLEYAAEHLADFSMQDVLFAFQHDITTRESVAKLLESRLESLDGRPLSLALDLIEYDALDAWTYADTLRRLAEATPVDASFTEPLQKKRWLLLALLWLSKNEARYDDPLEEAQGYVVSLDAYDQAHMGWLGDVVGVESLDREKRLAYPEYREKMTAWKKFLRENADEYLRDHGQIRIVPDTNVAARLPD